MYVCVSRLSLWGAERGWADVGLWVAVCFLAKISSHRPTCKTTFARLTQSQAISQSFGVFISFRSRRDTTFFSFFENLFYTKLPFPLPWWSKDLLMDKHAGGGQSTSKSTCEVPARTLTAYLAIDQHPACPNGGRLELWPRKWFLFTAIPLPIKLYVALRVGVAVILSQRPTPGTIEYSTNRFCGETYVLAGVLKSQVFKLCFGAKIFVPGKKLAKLQKEDDRRSQPAPTVGPTAPTVGPMQVSVHREIFNFSWRVAKSVLSSTVRRWNVKKRKIKENKDCGQRQREKISLIFRRASSLEKEIDDCLHLVRRISHPVDVGVHV